MKRIFAAVILTVLLAVIPFASASAEGTATFTNGEFLMADEGKVVLYINSVDMTELFTVPDTYYVKYIRTLNSGNLLVSYHGITGVLKSADGLKKLAEDKSVTEADSFYSLSLLLKDETTSTFYVVDEYETITETQVATADGLIFNYFGLRTYNEIPCVFVTEGARRGFIPVADLKTSAGVALSEFTLPIHPNSVVIEPTPDPAPPTEPADTEPSPTDPSNKLLRVILIIGILVPAILIIVLLFKPANRKNAYDRNRNHNIGPNGYDVPRNGYRDDPYYRERDDRRFYPDNYRRDNRPYEDGYYDRPRSRGRRPYDDEDDYR